nr:uncharacterized protein LOC129167754 [Nothobranchius furzeri]
MPGSSVNPCPRTEPRAHRYPGLGHQLGPTPVRSAAPSPVQSAPPSSTGGGPTPTAHQTELTSLQVELDWLRQLISLQEFQLDILSSSYLQEKVSVQPAAPPPVQSAAPSSPGQRTEPTAHPTELAGLRAELVRLLQIFRLQELLVDNLTSLLFQLLAPPGPAPPVQSAPGPAPPVESAPGPAPPVQSAIGPASPVQSAPVSSAFLY